jgi:hypothetical protein
MATRQVGVLPSRVHSALPRPIINSISGFGYHGDFINGWDVGFLQDAVNTCTNLSGEMSDCPLFTLQDASVSDSCQFPIPDNLKNDNPKSPGTTLPGDVPVISTGTAGPGTVASTVAAVPTLSYSAGASTNIAGGIFAAATGAYPDPTTPLPAPSSSPSPTPTPTTNPLLPGESIVSTMYSTLTDQNAVLELVIVDQEVTVYVSTTATTTATVMAMKRRKHRRHGHVHAHEGS